MSDLQKGVLGQRTCRYRWAPTLPPGACSVCGSVYPDLFLTCVACHPQVRRGTSGLEVWGFVLTMGITVSQGFMQGSQVSEQNMYPCGSSLVQDFCSQVYLEELQYSSLTSPRLCQQWLRPLYHVRALRLERVHAELSQSSSTCCSRLHPHPCLEVQPLQAPDPCASSTR